MKKYIKPIIHEQEIDREICLIFMSPPQPGDEDFQDSSSSETTSSSEDEEEPKTKTNNFDENPFQR